MVVLGQRLDLISKDFWERTKLILWSQVLTSFMSLHPPRTAVIASAPPTPVAREERCLHALAAAGWALCTGCLCYPTVAMPTQRAVWGRRISTNALLGSCRQYVKVKAPFPLDSSHNREHRGETVPPHAWFCEQLKETQPLHLFNHTILSFSPGFQKIKLYSKFQSKRSTF